MSFFRDKLVRPAIQRERERAPKTQVKNYRCFLVKANQDFVPTNWQDRPGEFEIIKELPGSQFLGRADAWRFMHNSNILRDRIWDSPEVPKLWAIVEPELIEVSR